MRQVAEAVFGRTDLMVLGRQRRGLADLDVGPDDLDDLDDGTYVSLNPDLAQVDRMGPSR